MLPIDPFYELGLSALIWLLIHVAIAGAPPVRGALVRRLGEPGFRGAFSLLSLLSLVWMCMAYARTPCSPLWATPAALYYLPLLVMPPAFVLLAGAFSVPNPTIVGKESALEAEDSARGVLRITRHPFLVAVALWSGVHLLVNGNLASLLFFGSLFLTAVFGTRDIDRKRMRHSPAAFSRYRERSSVVPFLAIARGKNRLVLRELGVPLAVGAVLTLLALAFHDQLFYVSAIPH
jgi:uncharacterized membrane protein